MTTQQEIDKKIAVMNRMLNNLEQQKAQIEEEPTVEKVIFKKLSLPMKLLAIWGWISLGLFIALVIGVIYLINKLPSLIPNG